MPLHQGQIHPLLARAAGLSGGNVPSKDAEPDPATLREPGLARENETALTSRFQTDEDKLTEAFRRLVPDATPLAVPAQTTPAAKEVAAPLDSAQPSTPAPKETDREPTGFSQPTPVSKPAPVREEPDRPTPSKSGYSGTPVESRGK